MLYCDFDFSYVDLELIWNLELNTNYLYMRTEYYCVCVGRSGREVGGGGGEKTGSGSERVRETKTTS